MYVHNICADNIKESKYPIFVQMKLRSNLDKIPVSCDRDSLCARGGTCAWTCICPCLFLCLCPRFCLVFALSLSMSLTYLYTCLCIGLFLILSSLVLTISHLIISACLPIPSESWSGPWLPTIPLWGTPGKK